RAGTTVIARVDGQVMNVVVKPLPLVHPEKLDDPDAAMTDAVRDYARVCHKLGVQRADRLQDWSDQVSQADALAEWSGQPSLLRLSFAHLHAEQEMPQPMPAPAPSPPAASPAEEASRV
ncbi:MAG TPA: hypothetical protein VIG28_04080, partial [Leifsonia sp.]